MDENIKNQDSTDATTVGQDELTATEVTEAADETVTLSFSELFASQPTVIQKYIMDSSADKKRREIYEKAGLTEDESDMATHLELEVIFGLIPLSVYPDLLWSRLTWEESEEDRAVALAIDVLGNIFLPAQVFLGDVASEIFSLGGNPEDFKVKAIDVRKLSFAEGVDGIIHALGDDFVTPKELPRLRYLIETRLRGVRDDNEFREQLMRAAKVGGLSLSLEETERVLEIIRVETQLTVYVEAREEKKAAGPAAKSDEAAEAEQVFTPAKIKKLYSGTKEERDRIKKRMERFRKVTEDDPQKMRDAFYEVLYPSDLGPIEPDFILAGLFAIAESGEFANLLSYDDRIREIMRKFYVGKGLENEAARFNEDALASECVNLFLQIMLRGFAGFSLGESARHGLRVVNLLKKSGRTEYANLVAFDSKLGDFRWLDEVEL